MQNQYIMRILFITIRTVLKFNDCVLFGRHSARYAYKIFVSTCYCHPKLENQHTHNIQIRSNSNQPTSEEGALWVA